MELKKATLWEKITNVCYTEDVVTKKINKESTFYNDKILTLSKENSELESTIKKLKIELDTKISMINDLNLKIIKYNDTNKELLLDKKEHDEKNKKLEINLDSVIKDYKKQIENITNKHNRELKKINKDSADKMVKMHKTIEKLENKLNKITSTINSKKLTCPEVLNIRKLSDENVDRQVLANRYNVSVSTIERIINKKTYKECI